MRPYSLASIRARWPAPLHFELLAGVGFWGLLNLAMPISAAAQTSPCRHDATTVAAVAAVRDGRTVTLDDGREIRLAGIAVPEADEPGAETARGALDGLLAARRVVFAGATTDRYGRNVAYGYADSDGPSLQEAMLAAGYARRAGRPVAQDCNAALTAAERNARLARRGLWAEAAFAPLQADQPATVTEARGRFALVEGTVLSVRESRGVIYLNFGRRWTRDFTAIVLKRNQRLFAAAGMTLTALEGRRIRVRGFIEQRSGPIIEAATPDQIERADTTTAARP